MVEDTSNLIPHFLQEIAFYISFTSSSFLIRCTVYEILRVFWKIAFENLQATYTKEFLWKYVYLNKQSHDQCVCRGVCFHQVFASEQFKHNHDIVNRNLRFREICARKFAKTRFTRKIYIRSSSIWVLPPLTMGFCFF